VSASDVWAVGENGLAEHWNGTEWSQVPDFPGGPLFAVGGNGDGGNNEATILEQPQP
jgi:hypothetical protein